MMYEAGYIEINDLRLTQAWLRSLLVAGYKFPTEIRPSSQTVVVDPEPVTVIAPTPPVVAHNKTAVTPVTAKTTAEITTTAATTTTTTANSTSTVAATAPAIRRRRKY